MAILTKPWVEIKDEVMALPGMNPCNLISYRGSQAHGMYVPSTDPTHIDDIDLMGFSIGPRGYYLGLRPHQITQEIKAGPWDIVVYEYRKLIDLLLKGNPNVMSLLWTDPLDSDWVGRALIANRAYFVGKHVYPAFCGYAYSQLRRMESQDPAELRDYLALTAEAKFRGLHPNHKGEKIPYPEGYDTTHGEPLNATKHGDEVLVAALRSYMKKGLNLGYMGDKRKGLVLQHGYDSKNAAHLVRLLRMGIEFLKTGELKVDRTGIDREQLLEIKTGKYDLAAVKALADQLFKDMEAAKDESKLPAGPDFESVHLMVQSVLSQKLLTV